MEEANPSSGARAGITAIPIGEHKASETDTLTEDDHDPITVSRFPIRSEGQLGPTTNGRKRGRVGPSCPRRGSLRSTQTAIYGQQTATNCKGGKVHPGRSGAGGLGGHPRGRGR